MRRLARLSVFALISAAPLASAADSGPGSRPSGSSGGRGGPGRSEDRGNENRPDGSSGRDRGDRGGFSRRPGGSGGGPGFGGPEWEKTKVELTEFLKKHAPNRWEDIAKSPHGGQSMWSMGRKFGELQMLKNSSDQTLYDNRIAQIESEDQEYGLLKQIAAAKKAGNTDEQTSLEEMLATKAKDSVTLRLKERQIRLAKFERFLAAEKKALAADEAKSAELVADRIKKMAEEGPEFFVPSKREGRGDTPGGANAATAPLPTPIPADVPPANTAP